MTLLTILIAIYLFAENCVELNNLQDLELDVEEFDCALEFLAVVKKLPKLRRLQCDLF